MAVRVARRHPTLLAVLVVSALAVFLYAPAMFGGKVLGGEALVYGNPPFSARAPAESSELTHELLGDSVFLYHPYQLFAREQLRSGELPLWNPRVGAGRPLGAGQGAPLHPLTAVSYVLDFWRSLVWVAALKMVLAALGTYLFCRRRGARSSAALLGGMAFAFGAYMLALLDAGQALAFGTLPWTLWLADRLIAGRRAVDAVALGAASGTILLNGHPESAVLALLVLAAYVLHRVGSGGLEPLRPPRALGLLGLAAGVAVAVGAVGVVSTWSVLTEASESARGGNPRPLESLAAIFFPNYWGRPETAAFPGPGSFAERALYVGTLPLVVAAAGIGRRGDRAFFAALALLSLALAVDTPLRDLVEAVPGGTTIELAQLIGIASLALSILAAFGLERLCAADPRERSRLLPFLAAVAAAPALAALPGLDPAALGEALRPAAVFGNEADSAETARLAAVIRWAGIAALGFAGAALLRRRRTWAAALAAGALALTALDLGLLDRGYRPMVERQVVEPAVPESVRLARARSAGARFAGEGTALFPNLASRYGLRDARAEDLPGLERYVELFTALGGSYNEAFGSSTLDLDEPAARRLLRTFAVRFVLADGSRRSPPAGFEVAFRRPGELLLELRPSVERAGFASAWEPATGLAEALDAVGGGGGPVIEGAPPPPAARGGTPAADTARARIVRDEPDRVDVEVDSTAAGYLVLRDVLYPGWSASVDGTPAEILPADVAFRAVALEPGRHLVSFSYRPGPVLFAAVLSAGSLLGALLALAVVGVRSRRRTEAR